MDPLTKLQELHGAQGYIIVSTLRPQKPEAPLDVLEWRDGEGHMEAHRWRVVSEATEQEFYEQIRHCGGVPDSLIFDYFYRIEAMD